MGVEAYIKLNKNDNKYFMFPLFYSISIKYVSTIIYLLLT